MYNEIIRITKEFSFDMAHALYGHDGLCKNIHGHTYKLKITLMGRVLNDFGNPKDGMLMDFKDLKTLVVKEIISVYDHSLLLNADSPHAHIKGLTENFERIIFFENQPTCENLVQLIAKKLNKALPDRISLHSVKLHETETSSAEWHKSDNL